MKTFEIKGQKRADIGKKASKEIRSQGLVPCVMYGGKENLHFSVIEKDFTHLIYSPHVFVVNLDVDGVKKQALMQTIQFHPVTDSIEHVDFLEISADKKVTVELPVQLIGSSEGVKQGGKLMLKLRKLRVKGLVKDFPDTLNVDISDLQLGKSVKVADLNYSGLELLDAKNAVVATVRLTRSAMSAKQGEAGK